jgi:hypothetical protein
VIVTV